MPLHSTPRCFLNRHSLSGTSNSTLHSMLHFCGQHSALPEKLQMQLEASNYSLFVPGKSPRTSIAMLVLTPACQAVGLFLFLLCGWTYFSWTLKVDVEQSKKIVKYVLPDSLARYLAIARLWWMITPSTSRMGTLWNGIAWRRGGNKKKERKKEKTTKMLNHSP